MAIRLAAIMFEENALPNTRTEVWTPELAKSSVLSFADI